MFGQKEPKTAGLCPQPTTFARLFSLIYEIPTFLRAPSAFPCAKVGAKSAEHYAKALFLTKFTSMRTSCNAFIVETLMYFLKNEYSRLSAGVNLPRIRLHLPHGIQIVCRYALLYQVTHFLRLSFLQVFLMKYQELFYILFYSYLCRLRVSKVFYS